MIDTLISIATLSLSIFIFYNQKKTNKKLNDLIKENLIQKIELNKINLEKEKTINLDIRKTKNNNGSTILEFKNIGSISIHNIKLVFEESFQRIIFQMPDLPEYLHSGQSLFLKYAASSETPDKSKIEIHWLSSDTKNFKKETRIINL